MRIKHRQTKLYGTVSKLADEVKELMVTYTSTSAAKKYIQLYLHCTAHGNASKEYGPHFRPKAHIQHTKSQHLSTSTQPTTNDKSTHTATRWGKEKETLMVKGVIRTALVLLLSTHSHEPC